MNFSSAIVQREEGGTVDEIGRIFASVERAGKIRPAKDLTTLALMMEDMRVFFYSSQYVFTPSC